MSDTAAARPPWPIETIERRPVAQLIPYARNARKHTAKQIATIAASIREFGWTMPVLIDEADLIIAGHGRVLAAPQLDLLEVPVIVARGWTAAQKRAYRVADNQIALNAAWDNGLLRVELADLHNEGFDLEMLGFATADATARDDFGGELAQALQLEPAREYAVIMCQDAAEWERLKVALSLARCIAEDGGVVCAQYIYWVNLHWDTAGGCRDYRTQAMERDCIRRLRRAYPGQPEESRMGDRDRRLITPRRGAGPRSRKRRRRHCSRCPGRPSTGSSAG